MKELIVIDRPIIMMNPESKRCDWAISDYPSTWRPGLKVSDIPSLFNSIDSYIAEPSLDRDLRLKIRKKMNLIFDDEGVSANFNNFLKEFLDDR